MVLLPDVFQRGEALRIRARLPVGKVAGLLADVHSSYDLLNVTRLIHSYFDYTPNDRALQQMRLFRPPPLMRIGQIQRQRPPQLRGRA